MVPKYAIVGQMPITIMAVHDIIEEEVNSTHLGRKTLVVGVGEPHVKIRENRIKRISDNQHHSLSRAFYISHSLRKMSFHKPNGFVSNSFTLSKKAS